LTRTHDFIVVGTSFSALVAIERLVQAGIKPLVLDSSEPEVSVASGANFGNPGAAILDEMGQKSWFGSNEPYRGRKKFDIEYKDGILARPSFAFGGFSRVWGASFEFELANVGARLGSSEASMNSDDVGFVEQLIPHVINDFREAGGRNSEFRSSASSVRLARKLCSGHLFVKNYELSPSRLAVSTSGPAACSLQGTCLTGCPNSSIYFAGDRISELHQNGQIELLTNHLLISFREREAQVALNVAVGSTELREIVTKKLLLATGPISSSKILISSGVCDVISHADTSTAFTSALVLSRRHEVKSHTLPQFYIREKSGAFLAQVYAPSESHLSKLQSRVPFGGFLTPVLKRLIHSIHPVIIYFNSNISDDLSVSSRDGVVVVAGKNTWKNRRAQLALLLRFAFTLVTRGVLLTLPFTQFTPPGSGYHFGAGLSRTGSLDSQGRPFGLRRVHILDASSLSNLPVGSITPTVMANSSRIVKEIIVEQV
jgi:hypothetical protein